MFRICCSVAEFVSVWCFANVHGFTSFADLLGVVGVYLWAARFVVAGFCDRFLRNFGLW